MSFKLSSHVLRRTALGALVAAAGLLPMTQARCWTRLWYNTACLHDPSSRNPYAGCASPS